MRTTCLICGARAAVGRCSSTNRSERRTFALSSEMRLISVTAGIRSPKAQVTAPGTS